MIDRRPLTAGGAAHGATFVPEGASRFWPFVIGTPRAYLAPRWNAHLLLWRGLAHAVLGRQPTEPRELWRQLPREYLATFMRGEGAGKEHPSRKFVASKLRAGERVLDVGCGAGVGFEALQEAGLASRYVGVDSSEPSIEVARELFPAGDFRIGNATSIVAQFGEASFDVVLVRHVLEHLPDFELAMGQAIAASRRLALFVFFLTPRALPFGVRKVNPGHNSVGLYTYIYSRPAIERFLAASGLHWLWYDHLGVSRAGWFAGEVNSALIVSRQPLD